MILGIGNDIVEVSRIKALLIKYQDRFLHRVFTHLEQKYCLDKKEPATHFAGRFAAKEAIVKALGTGFTKGLKWVDIGIDHDTLGKPVVVLSPFAKELFCDANILISMSHCKEYATAVAIWTQ